MTTLDGLLQMLDERRDQCNSHTFDVVGDPGGSHLRCVDCGAIELL